MNFSRACQGIVPPYLLQRLLESGDLTLADHARRTLAHDLVLRARLERPRTAPSLTAVAQLKRTIHDAEHRTKLPGRVVRGEGDPAVADEAVDQAYDGLGATWTLYQEVFGRNSIDGAGLPLVASVHYDDNYDNAFWNGAEMVFGDGDGTVFLSFTRSLDVIGHELTHGVTESTAKLDYQGQSGALNESVSDVFGSLVKQRALGQNAEQADWLIGAELLAPGVGGVALRSMKAPGTAYDDPRLGKDPQPADMSGYVRTSDDNGGVHLNSGIPNRAFYLVASAIGGNAWEAPGQIWYDVLTGSAIRPDCDFATFAGLTLDAATARFGAGSSQAIAVEQAWNTVGVTGTASTKPAEATTADLTLRRTGGFGGLRLERSCDLAELPAEDATRWRDLLASDRLTALADAPTHPDAFTYAVRSEGAGVDLAIPEPALGADLRELFERTLTR
jgi:hypothetical protein